MGTRQCKGEEEISQGFLRARDQTKGLSPDSGRDKELGNPEQAPCETERGAQRAGGTTKRASEALRKIPSHPTHQAVTTGRGECNVFIV